MLSYVSWHNDSNWLSSRRKDDITRTGEVNVLNTSLAGCCPALAWLHGNTTHLLHRCCSAKLDAREFPPLRPEGGLSFRQASTRIARRLQTSGFSLLMVGDSMAEQVFLSLICKAWSEGYELSLKPPMGTLSKHQKPGAQPLTYIAFVYAPATGKNADVQPTQPSRFRFVRLQNPPSAKSPRSLEAALRGSNESHVLLATWYERSLSGEYSEARMLAIANYTTASAARMISPHAHLLVMDGNVNHFPGGKYRYDGRYPSANSTKRTAPCDDSVSEHQWARVSRYNEHLLQIARAHRSAVVSFAGLHRSNGAAHVGYGLDMLFGGLKGGRDCLHWCLVPSTIDAIASTTLLELAHAQRHQQGIL